MAIKDSRTKVVEVIDRLEAKLLADTQAGAHPMQLLLAGAIPMFRQMVNDLAAQPGGLEQVIDFVMAGYSAFRADDARAVIILRAIDVPEGVSPVRYIRPLLDVDGNLERFCQPGGSTGVFAVELEEPLSVPDLADGFL